MDIGRALAVTLSENGLSAAEVSRRSGLSTAALSKYKAGKATPSLEALMLIAGAIGTRVSALIARAESCAGEVQPQGAQGIEERRGEYRVEEAQTEGRMLAAFSVLTDRQQRALLSFLEAMEDVS